MYPQWTSFADRVSAPLINPCPSLGTFSAYLILSVHNKVCSQNPFKQHLKKKIFVFFFIKIKGKLFKQSGKIYENGEVMMKTGVEVILIVRYILQSGNCLTHWHCCPLKPSEHFLWRTRVDIYFVISLNYYTIIYFRMMHIVTNIKMAI